MCGALIIECVLVPAEGGRVKVEVGARCEGKRVYLGRHGASRPRRFKMGWSLRFLLRDLNS
jgi:hypothetical protein